MVVNLLERDQELAALSALLGESACGKGRIAVIRGEAGIGKTSLVERFIRETQEHRQPSIRSLWAACEALFTPRPLGPLYDIAQQTGSPLRALLEGEANRAALFAALLDDVAGSPTILVIEDIHWADEATLDLIKYLARRMHRTAALLILTYRDDELVNDHPLRLLLGDLPTLGVTRMQLLPLSEGAVARLAQQAHRPPGRLHAITGGNPFFVIEALAYDAPGAPASVSDAVLTRIARRSPAAQRLLEYVAVVPNRIERWVLEALDAGDQLVLDECLAAHMLYLDGQTVAFRHELARQAVEDTLSPSHRQHLHAEILRVLMERGVEQTPLARLAHHAVAAEDATLVLRFAPAAARQAATRGAHREAVAHYQKTLFYADRLDLEERATILDELSYESYLTEHLEEAIASCASALTLWRSLDRIEQIGHDLRLLSNYNWVVGRYTEQERCALEAVALLESAPPGHELAMTYADLSGLHMLDTDGAATQVWGDRALELAERLHDVEAMTYALSRMGTSELYRGDIGGQAKLERSLELALAYGLEKHVAVAYANLAEFLMLTRNHAQAMTYLEGGIAYCIEHDIDLGLGTMQGERARVRLDQGDWAGAEEDAGAVLSISGVSAANRVPALTVLGLVRTRRGDCSAQAVLDEARDLALATGAMQYIAPMAAARAEWRWLSGDPAGCVVEAEIGLQESPQIRFRWQQSELTLWLWRSGVLLEAPTDAPAPFAFEMAGDWCTAADTWERLGCPYEQALALLGGDEEAFRAALSIFERLGATPAAEIARRRLHECGARGLPRGPRPATRTNPQGLTRRQLEILPLLAGGLYNSEIAERLSTSPKTVEHHVSAVLAKLNARTRAEAVRRAYELGILSQMDSAPDTK